MERTTYTLFDEEENEFIDKLLERARNDLENAMQTESGEEVLVRLKIYKKLLAMRVDKEIFVVNM